MNQRHNKSVTLLELIIAIILFGLLILGFTSIDLFSRYHLITSDRRAKLQNEVSYALEHMTKNIGGAIGNANDWAVKVYEDGKGIRIRIDDSSANGMIDTNDPWIAYRHEGNEIWYYPNATSTEPPPQEQPYDIVARRIMNSTNGLEFSGNFNSTTNWLEDYMLGVNITACWDPDGAPIACGQPDNPSVTMRTRIKMPGVSTH